MSTVMTILVIALAVPAAAVASGFVLRGRALRLVTDKRGIALQTVIVMVVLLAVAGGVAAVLLTRGGEAVTDIENQKIARVASDYSNKTLCEAAGFTWVAASTNCT